MHWLQHLQGDAARDLAHVKERRQGGTIKLHRKEANTSAKHSCEPGEYYQRNNGSLPRESY
jgi:hypothetical protein